MRRRTGDKFFEAICKQLFDQGALRLLAIASESNDRGDEFYHTIGLDQVETEAIDIGGENYQETTYDLREEGMVSRECWPE